jgi:hypothetical protein
VPFLHMADARDSLAATMACPAFGLLRDKRSCPCKQGNTAWTGAPVHNQPADFTGLILPLAVAPPITTPDDSALSKAISRQHRGGRRYSIATGGRRRHAVTCPRRADGMHVTRCTQGCAYAAPSRLAGRRKPGCVERIEALCNLLHICGSGSLRIVAASVISEGLMENRIQVAHYAATMTKELCRMCRKVELDDLAYLLEVAAAQAAKERTINGAREAIQ